MLRLSRVVELGLGLFLIGVVSCISAAYSQPGTIEDDCAADTRVLRVSDPGPHLITISDDTNLASANPSCEPPTDPADGTPGESRLTSPSSQTIDLLNPTAELVILGSSGVDVITIDALDLAFNAKLTVNAGDGNDQITVNAVTGTGIYTINGDAGEDTITINSATTGTVNINGGDGNDELVGPAADATWAVTGPGAGSVAGVSFSGIENLTGGDGADRFALPVDGSVSGVVSGGAGEDTLTGPGADAVWNVTAPNGGDVGGQAFADIENLEGAAENEDTVVFKEGGGLSGLVEGGDAGFDTLVVEGGTYATVTYLATGPDSGVIDLDDNRISFSGMEPVDLGVVADDFVFEFSATPFSTDPNSPPGSTNTADNIELRYVAGDGQMEIVSVSVPTTFEYVTFNVPNNSLTIDAGGGDDIITLDALDPPFAGELTLIGGAGDDTFVAPDVVATWRITGINEGTFEAAGLPSVSFSEIENLTGAANAPDTFEFASGAGISGEIIDGTGTLTVGVAGFVQVSGDDYDFVRVPSLDVITSAGLPPVNTSALTVGASAVPEDPKTGDGFVGVEPLDIPVGVGGDLGDFGLAIVTDVAGSRAWHAFKGTINNPEILGLEIAKLGVGEVTIGVNDKAADDTYIKFNAGPLSIATGGEPVILNSDKHEVSAQVPITISFDGFLHVGGTLEITVGETEVDVATGLTECGEYPDVGAQLEAIEDTVGGLNLSDDCSMIYDLPVKTLELAAFDASVFVGYGMEPWTPYGPTDDGDGRLEVDELGDDVIGAFAGPIDVGLVMMKPKFSATTLAMQVPVLGVGVPRFTALKAEAETLEILGIPETTIAASGITFDLNRSSGGWEWDPVIDWAESFPDEPDGFPTAGDRVFIDYDGESLIGASVERVLLQVSQFVHVSGSFAFRKGSQPPVDVATGVGCGGAVGKYLKEILPYGPPNNPDTGLWLSENCKTINNLPTETMQVGASGVSVFVGYGMPEWDPASDDNGVLDLEEIKQVYDPGLAEDGGEPDNTCGNGENDDSQDGADEDDPDCLAESGAIGAAATGIDFGLVMMKPKATPETTTALLAMKANPLVGVPRFTALKTSVDNLEILGIPETTVAASGVAFELNTSRAGPKWKPVIDWAASFPDGSDPDSEPDGFPVQTGGQPVFIDYEGESLIGASVERLLLQISEFVHVSGSFAFRMGEGKNVNVATGLTELECGPTGSVGSRLKLILPGKVSGDCKTISGLPVKTLQVGISGASIFLGYGMPEWDPASDDNGVLDLEEIQQVYDPALPEGFQQPASDPPVLNDEGTCQGGGDEDEDGLTDAADPDCWADSGAIGVAATGIDFGLVLMTPTSPSSATWKPVGMPRFIALKASMDDLAILGIPETTIEASGVRFELNMSGGGRGWKPVIDWVASFPPDGFAIPTGAPKYYDEALPEGSRWCGDGLDNDGDGYADAGIDLNGDDDYDDDNELQPDPDCMPGGSYDPELPEGTGPDTTCGDGDDDDADGLTDGDDPDCLADVTIDIDYESPLIGAGVGDFTILISEYVYLSGSVYFEKGQTEDVMLTSIFDTEEIEDILNKVEEATGINVTGYLAGPKNVEFLTIGAADLTACVGLKCWDDDNHNDVPEATDGNGEFEEDEINASPDAVGLMIDDVDFGLAIMKPTNKLDPTKYVALRASAGSVSLEAFPDDQTPPEFRLTASADDILIEANISTPTVSGFPLLPVVDFEESFPAEPEGVDTDGDGVPGEPAGYPVKTGAINPDGSDATENLDFNSLLIKAESSEIELNIWGVAALRGSIAFELGPTENVVLTNGASIEITTMTIGVNDVDAFIGWDGPQWECDPQSEAKGITLQDLNAGLVVGVSTDLFNPAAFLAAKLEIGGLCFVGLEDYVTADASLLLQLNVGAGVTSGFNPVDWTAEGSFGPAGFPVDTGANEYNPALDEGAGPGSCDDNEDNDGDTVPDDQDPGCVDTGTNEYNAALDEGAGPDTCDDDLDNDNDGKTDGDDPENENPDPDCMQDVTVNIDYDDFLIEVQLDGSLNAFDALAVQGLLYLEVDRNSLKLFADAHLLVGPDISFPYENGTQGSPGDCHDKIDNDEDGKIDSADEDCVLDASPILEISALGVLMIDADGVAADLDVDLNIGNQDIGLSLDVSARVLVNTTGEDQELKIPKRLYDRVFEKAQTEGLAQALLGRLDSCADGSVYSEEGTPSDGQPSKCYVIDGRQPDIANGDPSTVEGKTIGELTIENLLDADGDVAYIEPAGPYVLAILQGDFNFVNLATGYGLAGISVGTAPLRFQLVFDLNFDIGTAGAGLQFEAHATVDLDADGIYVDAGVAINADLSSLFHLDASGDLLINTYDYEKYGAPANSFRLALSGRADIARIIGVSGGLIVEVVGDEWRIEIPDNNKLTGRFGPITIEAWGWIDSDGTFSVNFSGRLWLGSKCWGVGGDVAGSVSLTHYDTDGNTTLDGYKLAFSISGGLSGKAFCARFGISASIYGEGVLGKQSHITLSMRVCVRIIFKKCATFGIVTIRLPDRLMPEPPPTLATLEGSTLKLNVGDRAGQRTVESNQTAESYELVQLAKLGEDGQPLPLSDSPYTVKVHAFGYAEVFSGVTKVEGDFGDDDDVLIVGADAYFPVDVSGGADNDTLTYRGSGAATLSGVGGDDNLTGGSAADNLNGGPGNDYLDGGEGADTLSGGDDDDVFYGTATSFFPDIGQENLLGGAGTDLVEIIGSGNPETGTEYPDWFTVTAASPLQVVYDDDGVFPPVGTLSVTDGERLLLSPGGGEDTVHLEGELEDSGLQQVTLDLLEDDPDVPDTVTMSLLDTADIVDVAVGLAPAVPSNFRGDGTVEIGMEITGTVTDAGPNTLTDTGTGNGAFAEPEPQYDPTLPEGPESAADTCGDGLDNDGDTLTDGGDQETGGGDPDCISWDTYIALDLEEFQVTLTSGAGAGQTRTIVSNTADTLTLDGAWGTTPAVGDQYVVSLDETADLVPATTATWSGHYPMTIINSGESDLFTVQTLGGDDLVQVTGLVSNTRIEGGAGEDRIAVGSNATTTSNTGGTVDAIDAALEVDGGADPDELTIDDSGDGDDEAGTLTAITLTGLGMNPGDITYGAVETLDIGLGSGADTFNIQSTASIATTTVTGGSGDDTFNVSTDAPTNTGTLNDIAGPLTVQGQGGDDTMNASDAGDTVANTGDLTSTDLAGLGTAGINYGGLEFLNVDLGLGGDTFTVADTHAGTTTVNAGPAGDTVTVQTVRSGATLTVNGEADADDVTIQSTDPTSTLTVNGGTGADGVDILAMGGTVDVNGDTDSDDVTITSTAAGSTLTVNGGGGDDWTDVLTMAGTVAANGDSGDDTVEVGSNAATTARGFDTGGDVDGVDGALTIDGGTANPGDTLYVDETGDPDDEPGLLTPTALTGLGMTVGISYADIEFLTIRLGTAGTAFNITGTSADTVLETGNGNDTVNVSSTLTLSSTTPDALGTLNLLAGHLAVQGQVGASDTMNASDADDGAANTGTLTDTDITGLGTAGVTYGGLEFLNIDLGSGGDTFTIHSTHAGQTTLDASDGGDTVNVQTVSGHTLVDTGVGTDTVNVGSLAPAALGDVDGVAALLEVIGGGDDDLNVDDTGDTSDNIGVLTDDTIAGLGMTIDAGHEPADAVHVVTVDATDGTFTLTLAGETTSALEFDASDLEVQAALEGLTSVGVGNVAVSRHDGTYVVALREALAGQAGRDLGALVATGGTGVTVTVTSMTDGRILYAGFEGLTIGLGSGGDVFDVRATHTAETTVNAGDGNDLLFVDTIAGLTSINGQGGDDAITVNPLHATVNGIGALLTIDGGTDSDDHVAYLTGDGDSVIAVSDTGSDLGTDSLTVYGTDDDDQFLLREDLVALLNTPNNGAWLHAERVTYDKNPAEGIGIEGLVLNTLAGDDHVALDDNSSTTTINGGIGADTFQAGQLFGDPVNFEAPVETTETTRGLLSNGVSFATTINGGGGPDTFHVFHNLAVLQLNGDQGDDEFVVRTFLESDQETQITAGDGHDVIQYVMNAPVSINGGDGYDTVVVIGTEADDNFVITSIGVYGAGRFVAFVAVEMVDIDGAEGDDTFTVLSTSAELQTRIFGGLGSDTINAAGDAPAVYADDLQGHSGLISHSVESTSAAWDGLAVDGIAADVADDDEPAIVITPTGGNTLVYENNAAGPAVDTYTIALTGVPTTNVQITVSAPARSPDDESLRSWSVEVSKNGTTFDDAVTLTFTPADWSTPRTIDVRAIDDLSSEGERVYAIQHLVSSADEYDGLPVPNTMVRVIDDEAIGVTIVHDGEMQLAEDGATDTYTVSLTSEPGAPVTVTIEPDGQVEVDGPLTLEFDPAADWWTPRTVTLRAIDDDDVEGFHFGYVSHSIDIADVVIDLVSALISDDDTPGVLITPTDGTTRVVEGGAIDQYSAVLTAQPDADVRVVVTAQPTETLDDTDDTEWREDVQVEVSLNGSSWSESVTLQFGPENWSAGQTVYVRAVQDNYVDGNDLQAFADSSQRVHLIQGSLMVEGGIDPEADRTIPDPVMLPGETSGDLPTPEDPAFDVIEEYQVDTLNVFNDDSVSNDSGTLTSDRLTGLGMGPDRYVANNLLPGGITYTGLEALAIHLGWGGDELTVESTHQGTTVVTGGAGNDTFDVRTIAGHTAVDAGAGDDTFRIGTDVPVLGTGTVDELGALLVISGGEGIDTATVDDAGDTDDNLGTLTQTTLTGLDMTAAAWIDRLYSVSLPASGSFTITLDGYEPLTFGFDDTAAEIQSALQTLLFPGSTCGLAGSSLCAQSVFVWRHGKDLLIGFQGEFVDTGGPELTSTVTDLLRTDGINYYGLETLNIDLGSGHDRFNVRGTLPTTNVDSGPGDDLVYVSDAAKLGALPDAADDENRDLAALHETILHGTLEVDDLTFEGSLDLVQGALNVETGTGSNTLGVSDRADTDPDTAVSMTSTSISNLAPAPITYAATGGDLAGQGDWTTQHDAGLFGRGINIYGGSGGNTFTTTSILGGATAESPFAATVTSLFAGEGADTVNVSVADATGRLLVIRGQGGDDTIDAAPLGHNVTALPVTVFGDEGYDAITGGTSNDQLFGDDGRVHYLQPTGEPGYDIVLGGVPATGSLTNPLTDDAIAPDANFLTPDLLLTRNTAVGATAAIVTGDAILAGLGNDLVFGGAAADYIHGDAGNDLVFGDFGWVGAANGEWVDAAQLPMAMAPNTHPFAFVAISTTDPNGAADEIHGDAGHDILLGQQSGDTLFGDDGDDDLIGGHNVAGGHDAGDDLDGGAGYDVIAGDNASILRNEGTASPLVRALQGATIYDDQGEVLVTGDMQPDPNGMPRRDVTLLDHSATTVAGVFGDDYIAGGAGDDTIFGQLGDDTVQGDGSIKGTPVGAYRDVDGTLVVAPSDEAASDGDDHIEGNGGNDVIFGNLGQDDIVGGSSDLFGLITPALRPDSSDRIFGGAGTDIDRNDLGDESGNGHARDADMILGDNGNIYRIVSIDPVAFETFNYDDYGNDDGTERIIPRAADLLDYTPGEADFDPVNAADDIGGTDEIHGESGDDSIYGMKGGDVLFGEGQDDDIVGGYGHDWISGGAGQDGVIGDDGRIYTSRNGAAEPLYGIGDLARELDEFISTPGKIQQATINVDGALKKTVNLTPFNLDPSGATDSIQDPLYDPTHADDIIYGGLGRDFLHGGAGDDAISGAEALPMFYEGPANPGDVLGYSKLRAGEFAAYDEYDPLRKAEEGGTEFLLNFDPSEDPDSGMSSATYGTKATDGDDAIFGDLGNDWLVGGTGRDNIYGGYGDDLLNSDDDHDSTIGTDDPRANDVPDTHPSYEDRAYGGAGRDVLIANTGGDRLVDWAGEFNSYIVPFAPFGMMTVSRALQPQIAEFLYALSASDGADPTRASDTGAEETRNGEPEGELGLVRQQDPDWHDQTGAPADPQPGNVPGGKRDVLRSASFNDGTMQGFAVDSGAWTVSGGALQVSAESLGMDAAAVYHIGDPLPSYFEVLASMRAVKPTGGWKANAYIIFDYQSPNDFKFAGIDVSIDKLVMGHRDESGWIVDEQMPFRAKPGRLYNMLLAVNGLTSSLIVDNKTVFTHTYEARVIDGYSYGLNWGLAGVGSDNSRGAFDNVAVRVLPPAVTYQNLEDFDDGVADLFTAGSAGAWTVGGGRLMGTPATGSEFAYDLVGLPELSNLQTASYLELSAVLNTESRAGFVFDLYAPDDFKWVAIDAPTDRVLIGHYTARSGWVVDQVTSRVVDAGADYTFGLALHGSTVNVTLGEQTIVSNAFHSVTVDGRFGLFTLGGPSSFDDVSMMTDDPAFD